jgi:hypothetical protein
MADNKVYEGKLMFKKETAGTVVYSNDEFNLIYVPKRLLNGTKPSAITLTVVADETQVA